MRSLAFLALMMVACGGSSSSDGIDATLDPTMRYEPWSTGAVWSYKLTDPNGVLPVALNKKVTVMAPRDVGGVHAGKMAFLVHAEQMKGSKDVYEGPVGYLDVRYQTVFFDDAGVVTGTDVDQPYRLRVDESAAHTKNGAQWSETYTETSSGMTSTKTEQWLVVSDAEPITVMAGSYTALHVRRTSNGGRVQDYWYVRGVGKVKETGGGQEEELMSFTPGQ